MNYLFYICFMKIDTMSLMTVKTFAKDNNVSTSYIYRLIREGRMDSIQIDEVHFITKGTSLPTR